MTRRGWRRLYVVGLATAVGLSAPLWAPPALSRVDAFEVEEVGVVGARYVPPDEIAALADVGPDASVWADPGSWEERVRAHPLVRDAEVRRAGLHRLEIRVRETEPVALVATPAIVPVDEDGRVLPLDPAATALDLPIVAGEVEVREDRVVSRPALRLLEVLVALAEYDPVFVGQISQLRHVGDAAGDPGAAGAEHGAEILMARSGYTERILLPGDVPVRALRRVELALARHGAPVASADARFDGQVVLRPGDGA